MAVDVLSNRFRVTFASRVFLAAQRLQSDIWPGVIQDILDGEKRHWDNYGKIELAAKGFAESGPYGGNLTTRAPDVVNYAAQVPRNRRTITPATFVFAELFDVDDQVRLAGVAEPNSTYMQSLSAGAGRKMDDLLLYHFEGPAAGGNDGSDTYTYAGDGGTTLTAVANPGGANVTNIIKMLTELDGNDANKPYFLAIHPRDFATFLDDPKGTSFDYNFMKPLVEGNISMFLGFNWIVTSAVDFDTDPFTDPVTRAQNDKVYGWGQEALIGGIFRNVRTNISLQEHLTMSTLVQIHLTMSAVRQFGDQMVVLETA